MKSALMRWPLMRWQWDEVELTGQRNVAASMSQLPSKSVLASRYWRNRSRPMAEFRQVPEEEPLISANER